MTEYRKKLSVLLIQHRSKLPLLILFLVGIIVIHQGVQSYKKSLGLGKPLTEVLIAASDLSQGQKISAKSFTTMKIPSENTPIGVIKPKDFYKISGFTLNHAVSKDEMIFWNLLETKFNYQSPSTKIEEGYRAVSVPVDALSSVSGMIQPGDHVDLITSMTIPGESNISTLTLLQNVSVLSVGQSDGNDENHGNYSTITLMVLPNEVNLITHAAKYANLSVTLRNPFDSKTNPELNVISEQEIVQTSFRNHMQTVRDLASQVDKSN